MRQARNAVCAVLCCAGRWSRLLSEGCFCAFMPCAKCSDAAGRQGSDKVLRRHSNEAPQRPPPCSACVTPESAMRVCLKRRGQQPGGRLAQLADTAAELERDAARWRHSSLARPEQRRACAAHRVLPMHAKRHLHPCLYSIYISHTQFFLGTCALLRPQRLREGAAAGPYLGVSSASLLAARVPACCSREQPRAVTAAPARSWRTTRRRSW